MGPKACVRGPTLNGHLESQGVPQSGRPKGWKEELKYLTSPTPIFKEGRYSAFHYLGQLHTNTVTPYAVPFSSSALKDCESATIAIQTYS